MRICCIFIFYLFITVSVAYSPQESNREVMNFNGDWKFIKSNPSGAEAPSFDDAAWDNVGLPHTYNETDIFDQWADPSNGDGGWNGKTWYRKKFTIDSKYEDRMIYLEIVAARSVADVWLNGQKLGDTYYSGFSSFAFDLTPQLKFGTEVNVLAISVDDTEGEDIVPGNDSHWHPNYGGLYSNVRLHIMDKLHVTLPLYSFLETEGTYIGFPQVSSSSAQLRMTTQVKNNYSTSQSCELTTEIVDAAGTVVKTLTVTQSINAGALYTFDQSETISNPHLWSPAEPYLYNAYSTLRINNTVIDVYKTIFGIRSVEWNTSTKMFTINGNSLLLKGWGQKPTNEYASLGPAVPDWLHALDIELQKEAGGNIIRWGHCAALPCALDAGDKLGVMQWQPNLSGESDYSGTPYERKMISYRDILIRDRNHPSIVLWEGNNRPQDSGTGHTKAWRDLADEWDWIIHRPYSVRRASMNDASDCDYVDVSIESNNENQYCLSLPRVEGEFYRPEAPRRYWDEDSPPGPHPNSSGSGYGRTQRSAMRELILDWESIKSRGGGVKWHFSDACTHGRCPVEVTRCSGSVDGSHVPKDMYYALKALWRDDPQVHIMGHWNYSGAHTVDVYTNCEQVELFVNDASQGSKNPSNGLCQWANLAFQAGTLKAVGKVGGAERCSDERKTAGNPHHIELSVITNPDGMKADRSDVALVDATIVDENGIRCPTAANPITFSVSGPGSYRGGYNSYIQGTPGKSTLNAEAGLIRVGIRSTETAGVMTVTATANGLESGTATITTISDATPIGIHSVDLPGQHRGNTISGIRNVLRHGSDNTLRVSYYLEQPSTVTFSLMQLNGKTVLSYSAGNTTQGKHDCIIPLNKRQGAVSQGCYIIRLSLPNGYKDFSRFVLIQ